MSDLHNATPVAEQQIEATLKAFLQDGAEKQLGIGTIHTVERLRQFKRPYSVQAVYLLVGTTGRATIYIKWFKNWRNKNVEQFKQEVAIEYQTMQFWYNQLADMPGATTFRPLYYSREYDCIITEGTEGTNLFVMVQKYARGWVGQKTLRQLKQYLYRTGMLLMHFQQKTQQEANYDYNHLVEDVDIRLKQLVAIPHSGFSAKDREMVLKFYTRHIQKGELAACKTVILHRDFGLGNILVSDTQIVVHDFNRMEYGHPYLDFTRLYHQLIMLGYKPYYLRHTIRHLQEAYCQGYGFTAGTNDVIFRFFLLRHFFTHLLGLVKTSESSLFSRVYTRWVKNQHLTHIRKLIHD